jgi:phospholipid/cholesterol/gamma-HCH transport system substrate-binding protein
MEAGVSTQIKVGFFLIVGALIVMVSILMIGGDRSVFTGQIRLHAYFDQVQGLSEGSVVSLSGVNIGNIERIDFVPEKNQLDVVMRIDKRFSPRIRQGSQVEIRTQGALGDKFIFVLPAEISHPKVKDGDVLEVAVATDIFSIISNRGKETDKIFDIISEFLKMAKTINDERRLEKIVSNMAVASENMKDVSKDAKQLTAELNRGTTGKIRSSVERLDSVLAKIDRGEGSLGALINDPSVHQQLKSLLGGSSRKDHIKSMIRTSIEKSETPY